ncbi:hypothetical protein Tco_0385596 [Tanacetum coccineum]
MQTLRGSLGCISLEEAADEVLEDLARLSGPASLGPASAQTLSPPQSEGHVERKQREMLIFVYFVRRTPHTVEGVYLTASIFSFWQKQVGYGAPHSLKCLSLETLSE